VSEPTSVNTGGGLYVAGSLSAHHVVGRDQTNIGTVPDVDAAELARRLVAAHRRIDNLGDEELDKDELRESVRRIEREAGRGEQADTKKIATWLRTLGGLVPDIAKIVAAALANPIAGVAAAVQVTASRVAASLDDAQR
jgi:hypothetical protein